MIKKLLLLLQKKPFLCVSGHFTGSVGGVIYMKSSQPKEKTSVNPICGNGLMHKTLNILVLTHNDIFDEVNNYVL